MTQEHIDTTRRHIGELQAMSHQTVAAEKRILERATSMLEDVMKQIPAAKAGAMMNDKGKYMELIQERGRLHTVIAQAKKNLAED